MNKQPHENRKRKGLEFSKLIVAIVMITYFVGVYIGARVVMQMAPDQLGAYLAFVGTPTATTIGFYCWKAKNENIHKNPDVMDPEISNEIPGVLEPEEPAEPTVPLDNGQQ